MNPAAIHLWINHLPVVGALVATIFLALATARRTPESAAYGYGALVVVGVLAILTYVSGNFAALFVEHLPGFALPRITYHQVSAAVTMIVAVLLGLAACVPLYLDEIATVRAVLIGFLIASLVLDGLFVFTAASGGVIAHAELR